MQEFHLVWLVVSPGSSSAVFRLHAIFPSPTLIAAHRHLPEGMPVSPRLWLSVTACPSTSVCHHGRFVYSPLGLPCRHAMRTPPRAAPFTFMPAVALFHMAQRPQVLVDRRHTPTAITSVCCLCSFNLSFALSACLLSPHFVCCLLFFFHLSFILFCFTNIVIAPPVQCATAESWRVATRARPLMPAAAHAFAAPAPREREAVCH